MIMRTAFAKCRMVWLALICSSAGFAMETVYQSPADFIGEYLPGCTQQALWLNSELKSEIEQLLDHPWPGIRVRYCSHGDKTVWIRRCVSVASGLAQRKVACRDQITNFIVLVDDSVSVIGGDRLNAIPVVVDETDRVAVGRGDPCVTVVQRRAIRCLLLNHAALAM